MSKRLSIGFLTVLLALQAAVMLSPWAAIAQTDQDGSLIPESGPLTLLKPLDGGDTTLEASPGIDVFIEYFNRAWPLLVGVAGGIAVLQVLVAGIQIMTSSGGAGKAAGTDRLQWAIAGLVMIVLAGLILRTLNSTFYL